VNRLSQEFPVQLLCGIVDLAPSTFSQPQQADELDLRNAIEEIALAFPRYDITVGLRRRQWHVNQKRLLRLMREGSSLVDVRWYCRSTTNSRHGYGR